jgi:hypothetical protein
MDARPSQVQIRAPHYDGNDAICPVFGTSEVGYNELTTAGDSNSCDLETTGGPSHSLAAAGTSLPSSNQTENGARTHGELKRLELFWYGDSCTVRSRGRDTGVDFFPFSDFDQKKQTARGTWSGPGRTNRRRQWGLPILMEVTRRPQDWSTTPMLLAVTPLPSPLTTPPVTRTYFMASIGFLSAASHSCLISRIRSLLGLGGRRLFLGSGGETEEVGEKWDIFFWFGLG